MDAATAAQQLDRYTVLDVREPSERDKGHIEGSLHMPMAEVVSRHEEIPAGKPVLVVCHSGARSSRVVQFLAQRGVDADNLAGGLMAWAEAGQPLIAADGSPGVPE